MSMLSLNTKKLVLVLACSSLLPQLSEARSVDPAAGLGQNEGQASAVSNRIATGPLPILDARFDSTAKNLVLRVEIGRTRQTDGSLRPVLASVPVTEVEFLAKQNSYGCSTSARCLGRIESLAGDESVLLIKEISEDGSAATAMPKSFRMKDVNNLVRQGLIKVFQTNGGLFVVYVDVDRI